jgi:aspartate-semialdehyde dehydrogenase
MSNQPNVGIVGATGAVGMELVKVLNDRGIHSLRAFATAQSAGTVIGGDTDGDALVVETFELEAARGMDVVFLAATGAFAAEWAERIAADGGPLVIDNSSYFRYNQDVPLVVPEINGHECENNAPIIANPNCTTAIALVALGPLHDAFGLRRVIMSTYQAASGAGMAGVRELNEGVDASNALVASVFPHPLAFNVIPHIDVFQENGYTKEEMKVVWEMRKILGAPDLLVSCTCVRIPTRRAHAEAITLDFERPCTPAQARALLERSPGVRVVDTPVENAYPMPLTTTGAYDVEVGRIRQSLVFGDHGIDLFVCGDQLLRGAALNAVLVAERANRI